MLNFGNVLHPTREERLSLGGFTLVILVPSACGVASVGRCSTL